MGAMRERDYLELIDELLIGSALTIAWFELPNYHHLFGGYSPKEAIKTGRVEAKDVYDMLYYTLYTG